MNDVGKNMIRNELWMILPRSCVHVVSECLILHCCEYTIPVPARGTSKLLMCEEDVK